MALGARVPVLGYSGIEIVRASLRLGLGSNIKPLVSATAAAVGGSSTAAAPADHQHPAYVGNPGLGVPGSIELLGIQTTPVSSRLAFGTDGTGWQLRLAKDQAGTLTDILTVADSQQVGVGLGTTSPGAQLDLGTAGAPSWTTSGWSKILGLKNISAIDFGRDRAAGTARFGMGESGGLLYLFHTTAEDTSVGPTYRVIVDSANGVGIGNAAPSPLSQLDLGQTNLGDGAQANSRLAFFDDLTNISYVTYDAATVHRFKGTGSWRFTNVPTGAGRFGVGTDIATLTGAGALSLSSTATATALIPSGLTGATAASRYVGATATGKPTSGTFSVGDTIVAQDGRVWVCITAGTPGTWLALATNDGGGGTKGIRVWAQSTDPGASAAEGDIWVQG